ncbi:hypothetical protein LCGC14_0774130 [marine sediment metagenome]|uniref:Uncharacterized protein n=1 Tax=marine sediment metagenome TaxID=412755 RepID=A0A0F9PXM6_9ZZZZ
MPKDFCLLDERLKLIRLFESTAMPTKVFVERIGEQDKEFIRLLKEVVLNDNYSGKWMMDEIDKMVGEALV